MKTNNQQAHFILILYIFSHMGAVFVANGVFWDDWYFYRASDTDIFERARQIGTIFQFWPMVIVSLLKLGPWVFKLLTFILILVSGVLLNKILNKNENISKDTRFLIVLLYLTLPFYQVRPLISVFQYTICNFLFFLAWYFLQTNKKLSIVLFFASFQTNSFLVFYLIPITEYFYKNNEKLAIKPLLNFCKKNIILISLPLIYFTLRSTIFKPYGMYENYNNDYGILKIIKAPILQFANIFDIYLNAGVYILCFIIIFITIIKIDLKNDNPHYAYKGMCIGALVFVIGGFPYWILGRVPTYNDFSTRHQLLLPLGASIFISYFISQFEDLIKKFILTIILTTSLTMNIQFYLDFYIDWQKQKQIITFFKNSELIKNSKLIMIVDESTDKNYNKRLFKPYEWNGMLEAAHGTQSRLGFYKNELIRYKLGDFDFYMNSQYKARDFLVNEDNTAVVVTIKSIRADSRDLGFKSELIKDQLLGVFYPKFSFEVENYKY